ncbi:MAG: type 1 glutamine amidotransferase [Candidatus Omnitrophota bacterium]
MKPVLFLKNIAIEGPGTIISYLESKNIPNQILDLSTGDPLPENPNHWGAVVVLGGPMNVDEEERFSYLRQEKQFIRQCLDQKIPFLGLCLGSQLLAAAAGASVCKNEYSEIGWMEVELTQEGKKCELFDGLPSTLAVFQWHGDTFDIPAGSPHLAKSALCRHQAFQVGDKAFGLQFHLEVGIEDIANWGREYLHLMNNAEEIKIVRNLLENPDLAKAEQVQKTALRLCGNFFARVAGYGRS